MSRLQSTATTKALELVQQGMKPALAAKECGISRTTLWRATQSKRCPCCGQSVKQA